MRPGVSGVGFGVALQVKDFHNAFPDRMTVPNLFDRDRLPVRGFCTVQMKNHVPQIG